MADYNIFFDNQLNISYLKSLIIEKQSRNKINFNIEYLKKVQEIVNSSINNFLEYFKKFRNFENFIIFNKNINIEVQANTFNISIIFDSDINNDLINYLLEYPNICYFKVSNKIYKNNLFVESINDLLIYRSIKTFHQNDDTVRKYLYDFIKDNISSIHDLILFGGEMYIFQNLINYENLYCYSDFSSIVEDTINNTNSKNKENIKLIDYYNFTLDIYSKDSLTICNTSKHGLELNISSQINSKDLIIISCNKKSFNKDYKILCKKYIISKSLEINGITFYLMNNIYVK